MPVWEVQCPKCGSVNQVTKDAVIVRCGMAECTCVCTNCKTEFNSEQEYWRWLGLDHGPASEPQESLT